MRGMAGVLEADEIGVEDVGESFAGLVVPRGGVDTPPDQSRHREIGEVERRFDDEREVAIARNLIGDARLGCAPRCTLAPAAEHRRQRRGPFHHLVVVGPPVGPGDRGLEHREGRDAIRAQVRRHQPDRAAVAVADDRGAAFPDHRERVAGVVGKRRGRLVVA